MEMAELGAANYAKMVSPAEDLISQREAYRLYGEANVKMWVRTGLVKPTRRGTSKNSKKTYSRAEIMSIEKAGFLNKIINR